LELGTHQDNMDDMTSRGRHGLPATAIRAIRKLLDQGVIQQEIADRYGVSRETISAVATGRVYGHVDKRAEGAKVHDNASAPPDHDIPDPTV
jgi:transcriptional regulator with XRE-family HTH domain